MTDDHRSATANRRFAMELRLVLAGVVCIFGGEAFCILGPLTYEHIVHISCHAVLYSGMILVGVGAALRWTNRPRAPRGDVG